ncbi:UDP-4-amino-4,6-dideoxy-N-acetyl-beta-L-altrosamine transaminase [Sulfuricystis multivorans]|uniref:UDP-4-amino-4, 6-dideoxy-N-acetyl-beta-L-altrosamine transaminase n=1 Tax=Sulfuricystis multivorans TaxID=2211108 RepID=UPI000F84B740|nr:UDP-4-amino-4,6-dideoxy-N-acetyl-beta-L-altrosamine transaminase [Sulfuricystis multivorans]
MIPYGRQDIDERDVAAVTEVLRSEWLTQGPMVPRFEQAVAAYCGATHAVAVNSATSALHLACLALGLGPGDVLWTSPITFVASVNCARYCGADVDFVDIDPHTVNMSVVALAEKLDRAAKTGRLPNIVVPVHFAGQPCEMAAIHDLGRQYGFRIIEDASHAIGARYRNEAVGNGRFSDITVFSFHPVKIITTGEGGMALTNDARLAETMVLLRSHGITRDAAQMDHAPDGPWYYQQIALGYNYRMTDIQAALGASQIERLDEFVARRRALARRYDEHLAGLPLALLRQHPDCASAWHLYVVRLQLDQIGKSHREVFAALRDRGIGVNLHYIPVHTQPYYRRLGFKSGDFPQAERYYAEAISLPLYAGLSEDEQDEVIAAVAEAIDA